jgi:hypothetical protein
VALADDRNVIRMTDPSLHLSVQLGPMNQGLFD